VNLDLNPERLLRRTKRFLSKKSSIVAASVALTAGIFAATLTQLQPDTLTAAAIAVAPRLEALPLETQNLSWGFLMDEYTVTGTILKRGDILGSILMNEAGLSYPQVNRLVENCKVKFQIHSLRVGK